MDEELAEAEVNPLAILVGISQTVGDISDMMDDSQRSRLGQEVVEDYEKDLTDREPWEKVAKESLEKAAQEKPVTEKTYPWSNASNVNYPLLTIAGLQFNARAYPAIVKGDEAVSVKVVGKDRGMPQMVPDATGNVAPLMDPQTGEPVWARPPGFKSARATRVKEYLNTTIFYRMDDWESDTDMLLMQLPIVGCAFRKVYYDADRQKHCSDLVPALNLVVPMAAKSCATAPRITEKVPDQYPYQILEKMLSGFYRRADFIEGEEFDEKPRMLLEQHRRIDLDGDGYPEPYVVTVDHESTEVLRVVANFEESDITTAGDRVSRIEPRQYYVKYGFFPHPEGKFYDIGLGHLLRQVGSVIDTAINQMIDAGTAAIAGGGFIGSGVRLQGSNRSSTLTMEPGKWKTVNSSGDDLRRAMVERTFPSPSPIMFQMLELMLGAAKDISSIKDVLSGEASNNGQVGTTLALIEQGLQVFTAIYKRIYRSMKEEFQILYENVAKYATDEIRQDYVVTLDDITANFDADFNTKDMDIRPVSDPSSVTKMQKMARANFLMQFVSAPGVNPQEIYKRAWEAADVEEPEQLIMPPQPQQPNPKDIASAEKDIASAKKYTAEAENTTVETDIKRLEALAKTFQTGYALGSNA